MKMASILPSAILFCLLQLSIFSINAQTLYGTTFLGGNEQAGSIYKFIPATNELTVVKSLEGRQSRPRNPGFANFIQARDGKLYGMTQLGGSSNGGVIFSFDTATSTYTKLMDFDGNKGANPSGSLIQASDGKLYGMTSGGGSSGYGVIFSFDPSSSTYTKLKDFNGVNGASPNGSLMQAKDGKLYGMTSSGGSLSYGVIFSFDPSSSTYIKMKNFDGTNGSNPIGDLIQTSDGTLYGMARTGGIFWGVIFSFKPSSFTYTKLLSFDGTNGSLPNGSLMQARNGKLYGMAGSVIFSFDPSSSTYTKLKDFVAGTDGFSLYGNLIQASDGKLYGMTRLGGNSYEGEDNPGAGVIFSFDPLSSIYKKLHDFYDLEGAYPLGSLMQARNGKLYGMTQYGGSGDAGVIFSFNVSSSIYTVLIDFNSTDENGHYLGNLVHASDGKLYGVTNEGGSRGYGVIFSFDPSSSTYIKLKDFDNINGSYPYGPLIQASDGKLYGVATYGGASRFWGVIFSFDPSTFTYTKLKDFDGTNGGAPFGTLIQASNGKLYGMTAGGAGSSSQGSVIFSFDPSSSTYTKLKDFDDASGGILFGNFIQASDGKLYGMASGGGSSGVGVIFSFDPSSSMYTKLKDFNGSDGANPNGSLIQASDGKLYGMTENGGINGSAGVIFSFDPSSSAYTKLKDFDYSNGRNPLGNLMQASDGKLYGMTFQGGSSGFGDIFSFDPSSSTYTKLKDNNGAGPRYGSAFIEINESNKPPRVNITSPVDGASYTALATILLSADASDVDGTVKTVDFYNGNKLIFSEKQAPFYRKWYNVHVGNYSITAKATDNDGNVTTSNVVHISVVPDKAPWVTITSPADGATYTALATITLSAKAGDDDGTVKTVDFYNSNTLIFTEQAAPFERKWYNVREGNYSITAVATDNNGKKTTSAAVNISVVPDVAPLVSITSPADGATFTAPATIQLSADASDVDGKVKTVDFYNGNTLIFTETWPPFERKWYNVPEGNYSITAVATDNNGKKTTSAPVSISVTAAGKSIAATGKLNLSNKPLSLNVNPNPVSKTLHVSVNGLQVNNRATISILSVSGVLIKTIQSNTLSKNVQLDVSALSAGVYFIKVINGDKILYKQFVKL